MKIWGTLIGCLLFMVVGCTAPQHRDAVRNDAEDRVTVGVVQKEIKVGMPSADVVSILGSPNMVTTDSQRREVWIYDKVSTEQVYSAFSASFLGLIAGKSGATSANQRTLTIIIKYDDNHLVRDFAYRQSSF